MAKKSLICNCRQQLWARFLVAKSPCGMTQQLLRTIHNESCQQLALNPLSAPMARVRQHNSLRSWKTNLLLHGTICVNKPGLVRVAHQPPCIQIFPTVVSQPSSIQMESPTMSLLHITKVPSPTLNMVTPKNAVSPWHQ